MSATLFRFHRGSLAAAMETVAPINSMRDLESIIGNRGTNITVEPYGYDERIDWDTHIVIITWADGERAPVGWTNGPL